MTEASCQIKIFCVDGGYLFRIVGRGSMRESPAFRDFVSGALEDGANVVVDLSPCEHLDSTFIGCLVILNQRAGGELGSFSLFGNETVRERLFGYSHLDRILTFVDELPTCSEAPVSLQVTNLERREFCQHLIDAHDKLAELGGPSSNTFQRIVDELKRELDELLL